MKPIITDSCLGCPKGLVSGAAMRNLIAIIFLFSVASSVQAASVVLDFEDLPTGGFNSPLTSKGFIINPTPAFIDPAIVDDFSVSGTGNELGLCGNCTDGTLGFSLSTSSGVLFEIDSFDLRYTSEVFDGTVTGYLDGGGTVSQLVSSAGIINFDSTWMNMTSIDIVFQGDSFAGQPAIQIISVDNVYLQAVPVPAAVWLFGSALAGLGWMRRKQTV
jgi:hypothetical protein